MLKNIDPAPSLRPRLLSTVEAPNYTGPQADLVALTGPGQDFVIDPSRRVSVPVSVPDNGSTMTLLGLALAIVVLFGLVKLKRRAPRRRSAFV
jgi:hypothetical protein